MVKVAGKPCLEWIIGNLNRHGITEIMIYVHYKADVIKDYFKDQVKYDYTAELTGTAETVCRNADWLTEKEDDFLVVNGDTITNCDITELIAEHKKGKAQVTAFFSKDKVLGIFLKNGGTLIINKEALESINQHYLLEEIFNKRNMTERIAQPSVYRVARDEWIYFDIGTQLEIDHFEAFVEEQQRWVNSLVPFDIIQGKDVANNQVP